MLEECTDTVPQSKHIVIFDTLIEQSEAPEVEAVLGTCPSSMSPLLLMYGNFSSRTWSLGIRPSQPDAAYLTSVGRLHRLFMNAAYDFQTRLHHPRTLPRIPPCTTFHEELRVPQRRCCEASDHGCFPLIPGPFHIIFAS